MVVVESKFQDASQTFELQEPPKFADLSSQVAELHSVRDYRINYEAAEGKHVAMVSDADLKKALASATNAHLNICVEPSSSTIPTQAEKSVPECDIATRSLAGADKSHYAECDGCSKKWILDVRFQCYSSSGYNFCFSCFSNEAINKGEYSFYRIQMGTRFDLHFARCEGCFVKTIVGPRYLCTSHSSYSLCEMCMVNERVNKDGRTFRLVKYPWQLDPNRRKVPYPNIYYGSQGPEVRMLQKLLTDIGYMSPDMYDKAIGTYGANTYYAVNNFRSAYGLPGYDYYDEAMADCLERVIKREMRRVTPSADKDSKPPAS